MSASTIAKAGFAVLSVGVMGSIAPLSVAAPLGAAPLPTCHQKPATIVGTPQRDELVGTPGNDIIVGGRGWDELRGAGGNDTICGGRGADHLYGGAGADWINGQGDGLLYGEDQYGDTVGADPETTR